MMNKKLIVMAVLLILPSIAMAVDYKFYDLELSYYRETLSSGNIIVKPGMAPDRRVQPEAGYRCEVVSFSNEILDSFRFEIPLTLIVDIIDPDTGELSGETTELDEIDFNLIIPYFANGKTINIYDPYNRNIIEVDVGHFGCSGSECETGCTIGGIDCNRVITFVVFIVVGIVILSIILKLRERKEDVTYSFPRR